MKRNSTGLVSLEYAMAAAIILPLILMMTDTANLFRARSVIAQSLSSTLRCLAAVNGDCINYQAHEYKAQYVADLYKSTTGWPVQYQRYGYETEWLETDQTRYFNPTVRILDTMTYREQQKELVLVENNSSATFKVEHPVMIYDSPYVDTGDTVHTALLSQFYLTSKRKEKFPRTSIDLSGIVLRPTELGRRASITFRAPMPVGLKASDLKDLKRTCFRAKSFGRPAPNYLFDKSFGTHTQPCSKNKTLKYVLQLNGNLINNGLKSTEASKAKVVVYLDGQSQPAHAIAARRINPGLKNNANFVPRGINLTPQYLSETFNYSELLSDQLNSKIYLIPGNVYRLSFELTDLEGTGLGWRGAKAKVLAPIFTTFKKGDLVCKNDRYTYNEKSEIVGCDSEVFLTDNQEGNPVPKYLLIRDKQVKSSVRSSKGCTYLEDAKPEPTGECVAKGKCYYDSFFSQLCQDSKISTTRCADDNYGTTSELYKEVYAACLGEEAPYNDKTDSFSLLKKVKSLPEIDFLQKSLNCSESTVSYPAPLNRYQEILTVESEAVGFPAVVTTANLPIEVYVKQNPQYDCPQFFRPKTEVVSPGRAANKLFKDTVLKGVHPISCNYAEQVKAIVREKLKFSDGQYIKPTLENVSGLVTYSDTRPSAGACYPFTQPVITADLSSAPVETFSYAKGNYPEKCDFPGYSCQVRSTGFKKLSEEERLVDMGAARQRAELALQASYPLAHACKAGGLPDGDYCYDLGIKFDGNRFDATLSLNLPVLSLFNQKQVRMSRTESHYWQGAY